MPLTFDQSKDEIASLVKHFSTNREQYRSPAYKEAHVRQEFIDPLFNALNWDVSNRNRAAPDYREVVIEESLDMEGARKAPDYVFRVGRESKFFAEAKRPGVNLKSDIAPAYQLRRYAWSAKLPLSILTDFEELSVYDCRVRPSQGDKPSIARLNYLAFLEFPDRWREVWDVFSRDSVWGGSFDRFSTATRGKRGTSEVDVEFLKEIEGWRDQLARNIALRNSKLSIEELNDSVQRTIDRIIFLRMAEDRGLEPYGRLQSLAEKEGVYPNLLELCRQADGKYNSGLFDFSKAGDRLTPDLLVDDKTLKSILSSLYYPHSPYEFSVLPAEILGNVYEQFLGKVIRLTSAHQAKVEEKPEVKRAGGVFYTPSYIVKYIVRNTVGRQVEGKNPVQLQGYRILDMACGSGSFLLGAFQCLLDHYLAWYAANKPERNQAAVWRHPDGSWRLTIPEKKRILTQHIFGVDIDRQAVEVTKLSLLLKVLEGEKQIELFQERALPNLDRNIKCGNSLIGPDYFTGQLMPDSADLARMNAFDWTAEFPEAAKAGGFDTVIGNPPYIRIQVMKEWAPIEVEAYKRLYASAASGNYDIYVVFVEKGLRLLNSTGRLGFILPHKFFNAKYGQALRALLSAGKYLDQIVHFGDQQVFSGASTYTCLMFLSRTGPAQFEFSRVDNLQSWQSKPESDSQLVPAASLSDKDWNFTSQSGSALFAKLDSMPVRMADLAEKVAQGIRTSANEIYVVDLQSSSGNLALVRSKTPDESFQLEVGILSRFLQGREIKEYRVLPSGKMVIIPYRIKSGRSELIGDPELKEIYPRAMSYLQKHKEALSIRENGRMRGPQWYAYVYPKNIEVMRSPKILVPDIAERPSFALDEKGEYAFTSGYGIILKDGVKESPKYILGLLNSKALFFYFKQITTTLRGGYFRYFSQFINPLPIRTIDFSSAGDRSRHEKMVFLVDQTIELYGRITDAAGDDEIHRLLRLIRSLRDQIDALVYSLYDLSDEEIAIVEKETSGFWSPDGQL